MKAIASAVRFLVFTNIYISACVLCFTSKTALMLYGNMGNFHVNALTFFSTLFLYGFHRVYRRFRLAEDEHKEERHHWVDQRQKMYYVIIGVAFIAMASQLYYMPLKVWVVLAPIGLIAAGYSIPFIKTKRGFIRIRDILWLKALWIAICYAGLTTFLPVAYEQRLHHLLDSGVLFIFAENLLFIFVLAIPFDIRDINYDKRNEVQTLPVLLGIKGAIRLSLFLMACFITVAWLHFQYSWMDKYMLSSLCISALQISCIIPLSKPERANLFFPLAIESSMILQWALMAIAVLSHPVVMI